MLPKYGHGYLLHWSGALFLAPSLWPAKGNYVSAGPSKELFLFKLMPLWRFENSHSCQDLCLYFPLNSYKLFCGYSLPTQGINCYSLSVALIWQPLPQPLEPDPCLAPVLFYFIFGHSFLVINLFFFFFWLLPPTLFVLVLVHSFGTWPFLPSWTALFFLCFQIHVNTVPNHPPFLSTQIRIWHKGGMWYPFLNGTAWIWVFCINNRA